MVKRIVITGGNGFIGTNLARHLRSVGEFQITGIDRTFVRETPCDLYDQTIGECFTSPRSLQACAEADAIVHLAANTSVQASLADPGTCFQENVVKTQILLEHLRQAPANPNVVFASTGGAIAGESKAPINESTPARPLSPYGATKLATEALLSAYQASYGMACTSLRFTNVYGPHSTHKQSAVAAFCKSSLETQTISIFGDGKQTRDFVHVSDVCDAIARVLALRATGVFQLGTGTSTSILDLARAIQMVNPDVRISHLPGLRGEVRSCISDIAHARTELGYHPQWSVKNGIRDTYQWFHAHG